MSRLCRGGFKQQWLRVVLDTNFGATPFRSLVYDGNAHFSNFGF